jgi:predicted enzyme related to lactoylglutathione lyase
MSTERRGPLADCRVSYLFLTVRDFEGMLAFYRDRVGLTPEYVEAGRCAFLRLDGGGFRLALYAGREDAGDAEPHWFLAVDVAGIDAVVAALRERGVPVGDVEAVPYGRAATFRDPEGNAIEVHEPTRGDASD